jgi:hypothetical protein
MPQLFSNSASTLLLGNISNVTTTVLVSGGTGNLFPDILNAGEFFVITVEDSNGNFEIMRCTARTGDSLQVTRAQESTTAKAFSAGDRVELRFTAGAVGQFVQRDNDTLDGGTF